MPPAITILKVEQHSLLRPTGQRPFSQKEFVSLPYHRNPLLEVCNLSVLYRGAGGQFCAAVSQASFDIGAGEIVGVFGASGSGKTTLGLSILRLLPDSAQITAAALRFQGRDLLTLRHEQMRRVRGNEISIMYQEPMLALNPVMRVGEQIAEVFRAHHQVSNRECRERAAEFLQRVHLHKRADAFNAYPHELSGGERHRVVIAQALVCGPSLVIADEPTAGLDAALQNEILDLISELRRELRVSFLLISHDHAVLDRMCDRTLEMSAGLLTDAAVVLGRNGRSSPPGMNAETSGPEQPLVRVSALSKSYQKRGLRFRRGPATDVLRNVDLSIPRDSTVALIGQSGSGKSTLARCLAMWEKPDAGEIELAGQDLLRLTPTELRQFRPRVQLVLQDSAAAFNPNLNAEQIVEEPLLIQNRGEKHARRKRARQLLEELGFEPAMFERKPLEFSGGQRQRLAIARALVLEPQLIIFDESTSGLDSETQRQVLALLAELKKTRRLSYLLISHDLHLVRDIADSILMMQDGTVVEGSRELLAHSTFRARS